MSAANHPLHTVIIGAGPYGLSLASHLSVARVPFRIFGRPMHTWATRMPAGMKLKSHGFASNLSSGSVPFSLEDFCKLTGRPYHALLEPVAVEDFVAYGREFACRFVPTLESHDVLSVEAEGSIFRVQIETGETVLARHVVVAVGLSHFHHLPESLAHLPGDLVTHTTGHRRFSAFHDRDVTVLGRGASSLTTAALLHEAGARVTLVARAQSIHSDGSLRVQRSLYERVRYPATPLGPSLRSWLFWKMPGLFHALPPRVRQMLVFKHLGPAGGWMLPDRIGDRFPVLLGWNIASAELLSATRSTDRRIRLRLHDAEGETREHLTSHIIAGTGFRTDLSRLGFLAPELLGRIVCEPTGAPELNSAFATSVPGLYMIGPVASATFGPMQRFTAGADFAARRVTGGLARAARRLHEPRRQATPIQVAASAAQD